MLFFGMIVGYLAAGALPEHRRVPDKNGELPGKENKKGVREGKEARRSGKGKKNKKAGRRKGEKGRYDADEYVRAMTGEACANLCGDLLRELRPAFSERYNAKWGPADFYLYLVAMCANAGEAGGAGRQSRQGAALPGRANLPSRSWFHDMNKGRAVRLHTGPLHKNGESLREARQAARHAQGRGRRLDGRARHPAVRQGDEADFRGDVRPQKGARTTSPDLPPCTA